MHKLTNWTYVCICEKRQLLGMTCKNKVGPVTLLLIPQKANNKMILGPIKAEGLLYL